MEKTINIKLDVENFYEVGKSINKELDNPAIKIGYCETLAQVREQAGANDNE